MKGTWLQMWDDRYQNSEYAYGKEPNVFLKEQLPNLKAGKILFGAEGEGRNAVFSAKLGWEVSAFDISLEGQKKAMQLATDSNVTIEYKVGRLPELNYQAANFDAIVLIYAHFPPDIRSEYHKLLSRYLKKDGIIILEAFSKGHLQYREQDERVGGPGNLEFLLSIDELKSDFPDYEIIELVEKEIDLSEGLYHNGKGLVVRFVGRKES